MEPLQTEDAHYADLVVQYFSETISEEDLYQLNAWLELDPKNKSYFEQTREIWLLSKVAENPKNFSSQKGFSRFLVNAKELGLFKSENQLRTMYFSLSRVAAIVIIAFCLGSFTFFAINKLAINDTPIAQQEVVVPFGSKSNVTLPDGSIVTLNAGSKLSYKTNFGKDNREVLLEGEGYFVVAKDKKRPFIVRTDVVSIQAYGTQFNVKAYKDDNELKTTLAEGSVGVFTTLASDRIFKLTPNQQAVFHKESGKIYVAKVDASLYTGWKDDKCYFENESFSSIVRTLERSYNVTIKIKSTDLSAETYTGSIDKRKTIYQVIGGMGHYMDFSYKLKDDTIEIEKIAN